MRRTSSNEKQVLKDRLTQWGQELGFERVGISGIDLTEDGAHLARWLSNGYHGTMHYMEKHGTKRYRPEQLTPNTLSVISARMDYWPEAAADAEQVLQQDQLGYVSRYALGRDYHKVFRQRLKKLAAKVQDHVTQLGSRVFVDSAPVLERALARNAGLGWIGKNTNLIDKNTGSLFFIGEIYVDLDIEPDQPSRNHCGTCRACLDICPTDAFVGPYQLDATKCISYLTIEYRGSIPLDLRKKIGNRIYGCDDCQLVCPWNKFAKKTSLPDFQPRHGLDSSLLTDLFHWSRAQFLERTEGSAIRRIGFDSWQRNIAVALGNSQTSPQVIEALQEKLNSSSELVREHTQWALEQHTHNNH